MRNKKGQLDIGIITFVIVIIGLLVIAPIILNIVRSTLTPVATSLNNTGVAGAEEGANNVLYLRGVFTSFWDGVLLIVFSLQVVLLFISALFIDTNPFFIIVYIAVLVLLFMFAPPMLDIVNNIYDNMAYAQDVALLGFMDFIRLNFGLILISIAVLSMIILYTKVRFFPKQ